MDVIAVRASLMGLFFIFSPYLTTLTTTTTDPIEICAAHPLTTAIITNSPFLVIVADDDDKPQVFSTLESSDSHTNVRIRPDPWPTPHSPNPQKVINNLTAMDMAVVGVPINFQPAGRRCGSNPQLRSRYGYLWLCLFIFENRERLLVHNLYCGWLSSFYSLFYDDSS